MRGRSEKELDLFVFREANFLQIIGRGTISAGAWKKHINHLEISMVKAISARGISSYLTFICLLLPSVLISL